MNEIILGILSLAVFGIMVLVGRNRRKVEMLKRALEGER